MWQTRPCLWNIDNSDVPRHWRQRVCNGVRHVHQNLHEVAEELSWFNPPHNKDLIDPYYDKTVIGCQYDYIWKGSYLGHMEGDSGIGIHHIQFWHVHWTLGRIRLWDFLKYMGEVMSKFYQLRCYLPICYVIDTGCFLIDIFGQVKDKAQPTVLLGDRCNAGHLELVPKQPGRVRFWE